MGNWRFLEKSVIFGCSENLVLDLAEGPLGCALASLGGGWEAFECGGKIRVFPSMNGGYFQCWRGI